MPGTHTYRNEKGSPDGKYAGIPYTSRVVRNGELRTSTVSYDCGCVFVNTYTTRPDGMMSVFHDDGDDSTYCLKHNPLPFSPGPKESFPLPKEWHK